MQTMQLPDLPLTVLDTETTGFIPRVNRVIEFASLNVQNAAITNEYECLVSIPTEIPAYVETITRIYNKDLEGKPAFEELLPTIEKHIGANTIIVGQNIQFDIRMLKGEGIDLSDRLTLDTSMLASLVFPEFASYSLPYISQILQLNHAPVHRALGDVRATTELLSKCWERLHELTPAMYQQLQSVMNRAPAAYKQLFTLVPEPSNTTAIPHWMNTNEQEQPAQQEPLRLPELAQNHVQLAEQSINPNALEQIIKGLPTHENETQLVAVQNLRQLPVMHTSNIKIIYPPSDMVDTEQSNTLLEQSEFTDDEATLAVKLLWYTPTTKNDIPLHGGEKDLWKSRLACHEQSPVYVDQFKNLPAVAILTHWQLLRLLNTAEQDIGLADMEGNFTITIENASLLEDTATKAFGHICDCHLVRVASQGNSELEAFADVLQLWLERVRNEQDILFFTQAILNATDAEQIRTQLKQLLENQSYGDNTTLKYALENLQAILNPAEVAHNIVWLELGRDDRQIVHSVPKLIATNLQAKLYDRYPVRLLTPPVGAHSLNAIVPESTETTHVANTLPAAISIQHSNELTSEHILQDPPAGKTIIAAGGRKRIEDIYVAYTEKLEQKGVTLLCQGFSGGMSRMQAEFDAHEGDIIMILSGFQVEAMHLRRPQVGQFFIESLPFDHPNHPVVSKRGELFRNAFMEYSLPRLEQRLYRICNTFAAVALPAATITLLDKRLSSKPYGKNVLSFVRKINPPQLETTATNDQLQLL